MELEKLVTIGNVLITCGNVEVTCKINELNIDNNNYLTFTHFFGAVNSVIWNQ